MARKEETVMKFSLIIPFFNAEQWIGRCLDSCLHQDIPQDDYELILIDDGSSDNSSSIAEEKLLGKDNVTILHQENKGQGAARNKGLCVAKGELVWFIDSDDRIEENCLGSIAGLIEDADILAISAADEREGRSIRRFGWKSSWGVSGKELVRSTKINVGTPFSIYRRALLEKNGLRFIENIFHEDAEFTPRAYFFADKVICTDCIFYYVYPSPGSTTRSSNPKRVFDSIETAQRSLSDFVQCIEQPYRTGFDNLLSSDMTHALKDASTFDKATRHRISECVYHNRDLFRHMKESDLAKFRFEGLIFSTFPKHTVGIMKAFLAVQRLCCGK